eukprot:UN25700
MIENFVLQNKNFREILFLMKQDNETQDYIISIDFYEHEIRGMGPTRTILKKIKKLKYKNGRDYLSFIGNIFFVTVLMPPI